MNLENSSADGVKRGAAKYGTQLKHAAGKTDAGKKWDTASTAQRAKWLKDTGSWASDASLSWLELMAQGGSQADVMKEFMERLGGAKENAPMDAGELREYLAEKFGAELISGNYSAELQSLLEKGAKILGWPVKKYAEQARSDARTAQHGFDNADDDNPACEECGKHMSDSEIDLAVAAGSTACAACRAKKGA